MIIGMIGDKLSRGSFRSLRELKPEIQVYSDFKFRPPKIFDPISAKFLAKIGPKVFGGLNQNSESIFISEIMAKY